MEHPAVSRNTCSCPPDVSTGRGPARRQTARLGTRAGRRSDTRPIASSRAGCAIPAIAHVSHAQGYGELRLSARTIAPDLYGERRRTTAATRVVPRSYLGRLLRHRLACCVIRSRYSCVRGDRGITGQQPRASAVSQVRRAARCRAATDEDRVRGHRRGDRAAGPRPAGRRACYARGADRAREQRTGSARAAPADRADQDRRRARRLAHVDHNMQLSQVLKPGTFYPPFGRSDSDERP